MQVDSIVPANNVQSIGGVASRRAQKSALNGVSDVSFMQILGQKSAAAQPASDAPALNPFPIRLDPLVPNLLRAWKEYGLGNAPL